MEMRVLFWRSIAATGRPCSASRGGSPVRWRRLKTSSRNASWRYSKGLRSTRIAVSLRAYLFGIARNLALKRMRLSERESEELEDTEADLDPLEDLLSAERSEVVARAVLALPPFQREAIVLFEYEELSLEEIAEVAGIEAGAVKARLHRARETLRRRLAPLIAARA